MILKVGKYEFSGTPEEILAFWIGYEMRDSFRDKIDKELNNTKED